jgi:chromosome segregation ATPase
MAEVKYYLNEVGLRALWKKLDDRDKEVVKKILDNKTAIDLLNATATTDTQAPLGSVERTVGDKVAEEIAKIVANAPADFDTLKEIADWISTHNDSAASMNSAIQENRDAVSSLKTLLGVDSSTNLWTSSELTGIKADIAQAKEDITTLTTTVSSNTDNIATHSSDIATMKEQIEALTGCDVTDGISTETINSICTFTSTFD